MKGLDNNTIVEYHDDISFWLVRADGGKYYQDFKENNFISISNNEVSLNEIKERSQPSLFKDTLMMEREELQKYISSVYPEKNNRQLGHLITRHMNFLFTMKEGDIVLVPSKGSKSFLIGKISSQPFECSEKELLAFETAEFENCPDTKRRKVEWLKEIYGEGIPKEVHWIFSAHQAVFNLDDHIEHLLRLVSPMYIYKEKISLNLKINTKGNMTSSQWFNFYTITQKFIEFLEDEMNMNKKINIDTQTNVQSPGFLNLIFDDLRVFLLFTAVLFGEIEIKRYDINISIKGIVPILLSIVKEARKWKELKMLSEKATDKVKDEVNLFKEDTDVALLDYSKPGQTGKKKKKNNKKKKKKK